jgi:Fe-S cluster biogenesis protein NfuA
VIAVDLREVRFAVDQLRPLVQGDGADLELLGVHEGVVRLRLLLRDVGCAECILPAAMLQPMLMESLGRTVAGVTGVSLDDPREQQP